MPDALDQAVNSIATFVGRKTIAGAEKEKVVKALRQMVAAGHQPDPDDLATALEGTGRLSATAIPKILAFYEGVLAGRQYRDTAGRPI